MNSTGWQRLGPAGLSQQGSPTQQGGGGSSSEGVRFRDPVDAARAQMGNQAPWAQYPDGYLGNITSRRNDRLLQGLQRRVGDRSYQRGVHAGEVIDPRGYFWPEGFGPTDGIRRGQRARPTPEGTWAVPRPAPIGTLSDQLIIGGGRAVPRGAMSLLDPTGRLPGRASDLRYLAPNWT